MATGRRARPTPAARRWRPPAPACWRSCPGPAAWWRRRSAWSRRSPRPPRPPWSAPRPRCRRPSSSPSACGSARPGSGVPARSATSFCSCSLIWSCWVLSSASCSPSAARRGQRLAGQILVALLQRGLGLALQLVGLLLQPLGLQLDPLARRGHVGHAPPHLLQLLELLLVGEVQRVARVLHFVQGLVGLGPEDVAYPTERACHGHRA